MKFQIKQNQKGQTYLEFNRQNILIKNQKIIRKITEEINQNEKNIQNMFLCRMILAGKNITKEQIANIKENLLKYAETDILYFYIEKPNEIYQKQKKLWPQFIQYIEQNAQTKLPNTKDIHLKKIERKIVKFFQEWLDKQNCQKIIPLQQIIKISNSLITGVNLCDKNVTLDKAWEAVNLEFLYNQKKWGMDKKAQQQYLKKKKEFFCAYELFENYPIFE